MIIVYCTTRLNTYIRKLDECNVKMLGSRNARCVTRVYGDVMESPPPNILPCWMVALEYQRPREDSQGTTTSFGHINSCLDLPAFTTHPEMERWTLHHMDLAMYSFFEDDVYDER